MPHDRGPVLRIQCTRNTLRFLTVYLVLLYYVRAVSCMWINGHAWIVTQKKPVDVSFYTAQVAKAQLLANGLLPRTTAPFFSVKLFEVAALRRRFVRDAERSLPDL